MFSFVFGKLPWLYWLQNAFKLKQIEFRLLIHEINCFYTFYCTKKDKLPFFFLLESHVIYFQFTVIDLQPLRPKNKYHKTLQEFDKLWKQKSSQNL